MTRAQAVEAAVERIFQRSTLSADGCRLWDGPVNNSGYAVVRLRGFSTTTAHRAVYEWTHGEPLAAEMEVEHACHTANVDVCKHAALCLHRRCVEPAHLELLTHLENSRRGFRSQATECVNGHEFTPENTWIHPSGRRYCRACNRDRMRAARLRRA